MTGHACVVEVQVRVRVEAVVAPVIAVVAAVGRSEHEEAFVLMKRSRKTNATRGAVLSIVTTCGREREAATVEVTAATASAVAVDAGGQRGNANGGGVQWLGTRATAAGAVAEVSLVERM